MTLFISILYKTYYLFTTLVVNLFHNKRLRLGRKVIFKKFPSYIITNKASIAIGNYTIINSSNKGYHANMYNSCKLVADRPNAIIRIGDNCRIHGSCIHAYSSVAIGNNCLIAANTQIIDGNGHTLSFDNTSNRINTTDEGTPIIIEDNVWIGLNCIILGGTHIKEGAIIAANSVVKGIVSPNSIYQGNPAILVKQYKPLNN